MGLPEQHRLRKRQDFQAVYRQGIRRSSVHFQLYALRDRTNLPRSPVKPKLKSAVPTPNCAPLPTVRSPAPSSPCPPPEERISTPLPTRFGISISQKVSKRAVIRNRIKRQIRAILRQFLPDIPPGWRVVISVRPTAIECDYQEFLQELKQLLAAAEVFHGYS